MTRDELLELLQPLIDRISEEERLRCQAIACGHKTWDGEEPTRKNIRVPRSNPATPKTFRPETCTATHVSDADAARFWAKVAIAKSDDCWLWIGAVSQNGYGSFNLRRRATSAHRVAFRIATGAWPEGKLLVRHKCDVRRCVNPAHLETGNHVENARDMVERGGWKGGDHRGEMNGNAKLNGEAVARVREQISMGRTNKAIGKSFGVTHSMISRIRRGKSWSKP